MTDPFSIAVGALSIVGLGGKAAEAVHDFQGNYRRASHQIKHVQAQVDLLQHFLDETASQYHAPAIQTSLQTISDSFPRDLDSETRRGRFRWAAKQKGRAAESLDQLKQTEISATRCSQLEILEKISALSTVLPRIETYLASKEQREQEEQKNRLGVTIPFRRADPSLVATVQSLGCLGCIISFKIQGRCRYNMFLRVPMVSSTILNGKLAVSWPSWFHPCIWPSLKIQQVVPETAPIVEACQRGDISVMRELFMSRTAHPNDTTTSNLTLLYLAIREGRTDAARLLVEYGADPNLTFGRLETSPLCTAFYSGNIEIARVLLQAGATLGHVTRRKWFCPRYVYDPHQTNLHSVEFLDLCHQEDFEEWDSPDVKGWTIFHRAAAFGQERDIRKLLNLRASWNILTFKLHWLPIFCAVTHSNESTFDILASLVSPIELPNLRDARGWTLLHIAARSGSGPILEKLLRHGCDPYQRSDQSNLWVPNGLEWREVTPGEVAEACGHQEIYERVLKEFGSTT